MNALGEDEEDEAEAQPEAAQAFDWLEADEPEDAIEAEPEADLPDWLAAAAPSSPSRKPSQSSPPRPSNG